MKTFLIGAALAALVGCAPPPPPTSTPRLPTATPAPSTPQEFKFTNGVSCYTWQSDIVCLLVK